MLYERAYLNYSDRKLAFRRFNTVKPTAIIIKLIPIKASPVFSIAPALGNLSLFCLVVPFDNFVFLFFPLLDVSVAAFVLSSLLVVLPVLVPVVDFPPESVLLPVLVSVVWLLSGFVAVPVPVPVVDLSPGFVPVPVVGLSSGFVGVLSPSAACAGLGANAKPATNNSLIHMPHSSST